MNNKLDNSSEKVSLSDVLPLPINFSHSPIYFENGEWASFDGTDSIVP